MSANKMIHIIGGGTVSHIKSHFALCSPAYGTTARKIYELCQAAKINGRTALDSELHLTRMGGGWNTLNPYDLTTIRPPETNEDVANLIKDFVADPKTKIVFMNAALCDYELNGPADKYGKRFNSREEKNLQLNLIPAQKVIGNIRKTRKDIFAVGFKETSGASPDEQYIAGLNLLKEASLNLVLANDVKTRFNMVITPEEARYHETTNRDSVLHGLVEMALLRSHLTFTRSTVVDGKPIPWESELIPPSLRTVVNYCIERGAYKPFRGATVGHFACKIGPTTFLTSIRKSNFNDLYKNGLVKVETDGPDSVLAYGAKPSVGGQSQRIVFDNHKEYDCIVHFHSPKKPGSKVPEVSQREYECGSHQCGNNTSKGLQKFGNLSAVYLQEHGPNIVFHRSINPIEVIDFIERNFDLEKKTGGYVDLGKGVIDV